MSIKNVGYVEGIEHQNAFKVVEKHENVTDRSTGVVNGFSFNVEKLPEPLEKHHNQKIVHRSQSIESYKVQSAESCNKEGQENLKFMSK